jgi:hypothetical protein
MSTIDSITNTAVSTAQSTSKRKASQGRFPPDARGATQNQDPLNPLDGTDFAAQLARYPVSNS